MNGVGNNNLKSVVDRRMGFTLESLKSQDYSESDIFLLQYRKSSGITWYKYAKLPHPKCFCISTNNDLSLLLQWLRIMMTQLTILLICLLQVVPLLEAGAKIHSARLHSVFCKHLVHNCWWKVKCYKHMINSHSLQPSSFCMADHRFLCFMPFSKILICQSKSNHSHMVNDFELFFLSCCITQSLCNGEECTCFKNQFLGYPY